MPFPESLKNDFDVLDRGPSGRILPCYRVRERKPFGREFAMRLLPDSFCSDKGIVDAFHEFFARFSEISNKTYLAQVHSVVGAVNRAVYVLEEFVSGIPLTEFIEKNQSSVDFNEDAINIIARVCEALHYAHQKDIFHLSVSPDDILIDENNPSKVKLMGFGAQIFASKGKLDYLSIESRTYIAPEVFKRGVFGPKADVYSLAAGLREAVPEIVNWGELLSRCLSKTPSDRPPSARTFAQELKDLVVKQKSRPRKQSAANNAGGLQPLINVKTTPEGAKVSLNGASVGITTASGLRIPWKQGRSIEITKSGFATETLNFTDSPDNSEITVKLKSAFRLFSNPWGASVLVDGKHVGVTDRDGIMVPWDGSTIGIEKAGYKSESLKFLSPPTENQSSVELQPAISSVAPKRHPLEVVGYAMAAIVLWLLPLVIYGGLHTAGVGEKVTDKDSQIANLVSNNVTLKKEVDQKDEEINSAKKTLDQERLGAKKEIERLSGEISQLTGGIANLRGDLNKRDDEIARLKKVELEKERLEREIPSLKSEADRWRKDYYSQNQAITSKDQEIARLKHKPPEPSRTVQDEVPKLQKLTGSGDAAAQAELGDRYFRGVGVTKNYDEAFGLFKKSAKMGNAHAQSRLGWMYEAGFGVAKDKTEALNWYKEASRQGDVFAKNRLRALSNH